MLKFDSKLCITQRPGEPNVSYQLVRPGLIAAMIAGITTGTCPPFTDGWLKDHPNALARPISELRVTLRGVTSTVVYIWIEDGKESLNLALIAQGIFLGRVMAETLETVQAMKECLDPHGPAATPEQIERLLAETLPEERPKLLVTDADFAERIKKVVAAEKEARQQKRGIWSDEYQLPSERYARDYFVRHKNEFVRFAALLQKDPSARYVGSDGMVDIDGFHGRFVSEYRDLCRALKLKFVTVREDGSIDFCLWGWGGAIMSDSYMGVHYRPKDRGPYTGPGWSPTIVATLDEKTLPQENGRVATGYYAIAVEQEWFIYRFEYQE